MSSANVNLTPPPGTDGLLTLVLLKCVLLSAGLAL